MVNMKKIFQYIIDNIKIFLSITGAVSVIGGTAWGIAEWKAHQENQVKEVKTEIQQVKNTLTTMSRNDSIIIYEIRGTKETVENIKQVVDKQSTIINALDESYRKHLEQDKRYDILIQYMNRIDEQLKKNLKGTAYLENNLLIQQELK